MLLLHHLLLHLHLLHLHHLRVHRPSHLPPPGPTAHMSSVGAEGRQRAGSGAFGLGYPTFIARQPASVVDISALRVWAGPVSGGGDVVARNRDASICAHLATTVTLHSPRVIGVFATATPPIVSGNGDCWSDCRGFAVANIVAFRDGGFIYFTKSEDLGRAVTKRCVTLGRFLGLSLGFKFEIEILLFPRVATDFIYSNINLTVHLSMWYCQKN